MLWNDYMKIKEKKLQMFDINEFNENLDFRIIIHKILIYKPSFNIIVETIL